MVVNKSSIGTFVDIPADLITSLTLSTRLGAKDPEANLPQGKHSELLFIFLSPPFFCGHRRGRKVKDIVDNVNDIKRTDGNSRIYTLSRLKHSSTPGLLE
jgi:hypothetical protein